jgi:hypothetical protein
VTPAAGFRELLETFERLHISYLVGGSLASSVHGVPRATRDIDLIAEIQLEKVGPLTSALAPHFYADADMMRQSMALGRAFNVIHLASAYKFDIFPAKNDAYTRIQFERRQERRFAVEDEEVQFQVASAEDTILSKLVWYKSGGGISEQQWRDILNVIDVRGDTLDRPYLREWAARLGVSELLAEALR